MLRVYSTQRLNSNDQLTRTFAALADPTRRAILRRLAHGEATVTELAEPFPVTLQAVSKHLHVLEDAGLVVRRRDGSVVADPMPEPAPPGGHGPMPH